MATDVASETFLEESASLLVGLRMGGVGVWRWKIDSDALQWTANLENVHDLPAGSFDGTLSSFQNDIHPDDVQKVWSEIQTTLRTGAPYRTVYRTAPRIGEETLWIEASGGIVGATDGTRFLTGICHDVTARIRDEQELQRRLNQQSAIARFGSFALGEGDFQNILDRAVTLAAEILDLPLSKILEFADSADHLVLRAGLGWKPGLVGEAAVGIEMESQAGFTLVSEEPVIVDDLRRETRFSGPQLLHDHGVRSGMSVTVPGIDQRPFGVFGVHDTRLRSFSEADVEFFVALANIVANSARQRAADQQRNLLLREMAHRAGNMLQLVSTIANQTFVAERDAGEARAAFSERLASLSRANFLVAHGGWSETRIILLVEEALQPFRERLDLRGGDILLPPDLSFDLALILHELSTNSAKYGSLGAGDGEIEISWSLARDEAGERVLRIVWHDPQARPEGEQDGESGAKGTGFGAKLLKALIERKWRGEIEVDRRAGYRFAFTIRLAAEA
jgi:two-component sensor histidine kinase